jgi:hypothetical protein
MKKVLLVLLAVSWPALAQSPTSVKSLSFMSGCWTTPKGALEELRECFTAPYAGLIQGSSQTVKDGKTTQIEFAAIHEKDGKITYAPIFNGKALSVFTLTRVENKTATFENPTNDFPKKIIYRRNADGSLTARTEGADPSDKASQEWTMVAQGM